MNLTQTLADVGERAAIREITSVASSGLNGDDAAVLPSAPPNSRTVAATDLMVEGRHFLREWSTPREIGKKAILRNFADVEAMGARPVAALLAIAAPGDTPVPFVRGIAEGIAEHSSFYNAELVGGDLTKSDLLVINITAVGFLGGSLPALTLDGARAGQQVVAHGRIGHSAAGLALLERFGRNLPAGHEHLQPLIDAHCAPWLNPGRGVIARAAGVTAMTDNSDGLIQDCTTMAEHSCVHMDLDPQALQPEELLCQAADLLDCDPWEWVLSGGEDHTLIGTTAKEAPSGFRKIGTVTRGCGVTLGGTTPSYQKGWLSF